MLNSVALARRLASQKFLTRSRQMIDLARQQSEIKTQIFELSEQQLKAVKRATFMGWSHEESTAYVERRNTIALLRSRLSTLDSAETWERSWP